jgi:RNA polymerase sigma factor (sigma-70 family)
MKANEFKIKVLPVNRKIFPFALRLMRNKEEAEDIVQEVFVKLWNMRDRLVTLNSIEAFAMKITKNLCLDKIKARKTFSLEDSKITENPVNQEESPGKQLELKDTLTKVKQIIDKLPEQHKMVIHLRDIEGYSYAEITEILDININTLRVNLSRARKTVRELLLKSMNYGPEKNRNIITEIL